MPPSHDMQSPMRQRPKPVANGFGVGEDSLNGFDLRDTLTATVVRELDGTATGGRLADRALPARARAFSPLTQGASAVVSRPPRRRAAGA